MDPARVVFLCICVFAGVANAQVASICRPKERLLMCGGCQRTCLDPVPECKGVCRPGCYCGDDEVRNATGHCVKLSECPPIPVTYKQETTEPRPEAACPEHEEYRFCEACNRTCDSPKPICPAQCSRGCFCKDDLVRDRDGRCVKLDKCSTLTSNEIPHSSSTAKPVHQQCGENQAFKLCSNCEKSCSNPNPICPAQCSRGCFCKEGYYKAPNGDCVTMDKCPKAIPTQPTPIPIVYELTCAPNQVFKTCENCEKTCSSPNPICPAQCSKGCFCKDGLFKAPNGDCVRLENCPKAEISMGAAGPTIEDCDADEEFFSCGWCEPSCSDPEPACPLKVCTRGCLCRPPLLRHRSGHCVEKRDCLGQKCPPNEEYICRYGCEARCARRACVVRARRCRLACHCRHPLLRARDGTCVQANQCD